MASRGGFSRTQHMAATSMREGERRTMYYVSRIKRQTAATSVDTYTKHGSYCGDWRGDMRDGYGVQIYRNGDKYEGNWVADKWDGRGTLWRAGADGGGLAKSYEGEFRAGRFDGLGRLYGRDGSVYEGGFAEGQRSGQGVLRLASGETYNGEWVGDAQHGRGRLTLENGDTFDGYFVAGKKHGPGQFHYVSKRTVYVGEWVDDVARCGVMQPEGGRSPAEQPLFPPLGLVDGDAVLQESVAAARAEAAADHSGEPGSGGGAADGYSHGGLPPELSAEDVEELRRAFASADAGGDGRIPADVQVLGGVLGALGIEASHADAAALLRDLAAEEAEDPEGVGSTGDAISFRAFVVTMARLRQ